MNINKPSRSSLSKDEIDSIWTNPNHLDLLEMKRSSLIPITPNPNSFDQILPHIRRLYTIFDSICPNIYRIHCSDSLRILNEILCLTNEYLHISSSSNEIFLNEKSFDDFILKLRRPSIIPKKSLSIIKTELHCFGQGIDIYNSNNQLNQTILFCFELTTTNLSSPIDIIIKDPEGNFVPTDMKYINTYNHDYTKLFSCSYTPKTKSGIYQISFFYNNIQISNQQYSILIQDSKKERLLSFKKEIPEYQFEGDGYLNNIIVNSIARFRLRIKSDENSIIDSFSISILDPYGHTIVVQHRILSPDLLELTYQPMSIGEHQLILLFNKQIHHQLMINVIHDELNYLSNLKPFGPGLKRAILGLPTEFYVHLNQTTNNNNNNIHFRLEPSYYAEIDYEQQLATVRYVPDEEGNCPIHILENDKDILHSPFIAHIEKNVIGREKPRIRVIGLSKKIILHRPVEFQVFIDNPFDDSNHSLHVDILMDDKNSPNVSIRRRHRSSYVCSFIPITLGKYFISIDYAGIVAENNPFSCQGIQEKDIFLTGPAMTNQCLELNKPTHFSFALKDFLTTDLNEKNSTYESGYSSNDDISSKSSLSSSTNDIRTLFNEEDNNYRVTITDGHGHIKSNVQIDQTKNENNIRVDFTPDEQILYINISCTW